MNPNEVLDEILKDSMKNKEETTMEKLLTGLNAFFSREDIPQKTILSEINVVGIVEADAWNNFLEKNFGFRDEIVDKIIESRRINNKSIKGVGIKYMIDFVKAFSTGILQDDDKKEENLLKRLS